MPTYIANIVCKYCFKGERYFYNVIIGTRNISCHRDLYIISHIVVYYNFFIRPETLKRLIRISHIYVHTSVLNITAVYTHKSVAG